MCYKVTAYLILLLSASIPAGAQSARGTLTGQVKDPTGALIPGATVIAINEQTGMAATVQAQNDGAFVIPQLQPGDYRLVGQAQGFKRLEITGLKVDIGATLTQDLLLEVGGVAETVEVSGETSLVLTSSGQIATTIQTSQVLEMPLSDRNVFNLINLVPGAFRSGGSVSLGGGHSRAPLAMLDGVNNTRGGLGNSNIELAPPVDSMQEFNVVVSNISAEYGRTSGGMVNAVTKGGTNQFHGSLYNFLRNDKLDAAGWNADRKPALRRNNFGGTFGGPIIRNRTFLFYNLDGMRENNPQPITRSVGLPEWHSGDFSRASRDAGGRAVLVPIHDPETGTGTFTTPRGTVPFPNNIIPASRLDPVAVKGIRYMPGPNRSPDNQFNQSGNWQVNRLSKVVRDAHTIRVDHELTSRTRLFYRHLFSLPETSSLAYTQDFGVADPEAYDLNFRHQNAVLNVTHLFTPTFFLNFNIGFNRLRNFRTAGDCCDKNYGQLLGIANVPGEAFPRFNVSGGLVPVSQIGHTNDPNRIFMYTNTNTEANFTSIQGNHTLKFGAQSTRYNGNDLGRSMPSGQYGFDGRFTRGAQPDGTAIANTGIVLADFLLGRLNTVDARIGQGIGKRIQYLAGYFQNDWRVTSSLTLNLGLRYDTEVPVWEVANRHSNFDPYLPNPLAGTGDIPAGAVGVVTFSGRNGRGRYLWDWDKNNFAPRFGFAWRVLGSANTSLRGGYGIFYSDPYESGPIAVGNAGFVQSYSAQHPIPFRLRDGIPPGVLDIIPESELLPTFGNRGTRFAASGVNFFAPDRVTPFSQNFNLTLQHQWKGVLFEAGYIGNLGRRLPYPNLNLNQIPPELLSRTDVPQRLRRPWTIFTSDQPSVTVSAPTVGFSHYHGFTLKSERRFRGGFGWVVAYTFTRWIDNVIFGAEGFGDNDGPQNIYNLGQEKATSTNSIPHRIVLAPIVDLPFGQGRKWMNRGGILDAVLGGWQVATMGTLRSGAPLGATVLNGPRDVLGDPAGGRVLRADLLEDPLLPASQRGEPASGVRGLQWLNPAAFRVPARYTLGNAARTIPGVLGPGSVQFDCMLAKNFRWRERFRVQFRWETFNTFNTPQFQLPNDVLGGSAFGIVTAAGGRRIMQFGLKLYF